MPCVAPGGAVLLEVHVDKSHELHGDCPGVDPNRPPAPATLRPSLLDVWRHLPGVFPDFEYLENLSGIAPVGIAFRAG
jgi:hypothetical protein